VDECRSSTPKKIAPFLLAMAMAALPGAFGCDDFDTNREVWARGSAGEQVYGLMCDRVGAQGLHDDLSGASFRDVCHRPPGGKFADKVDVSQLPPLDPEAVDASGKTVPSMRRRRLVTAESRGSKRSADGVTT
jgi:hypothetical protein